MPKVFRSPNLAIAITAFFALLSANLAPAADSTQPATQSATQTASTQPSLISIEGAVTKPQSWTTAQLKTDFAREIKTIKFAAKTDSHTAAAIPLLSVINAAVPKLDAKVKNDQLRIVVIVEGKDGYIATFALAELLPTNGNREAYLALDTDEKPLSDRDAPASLVVPSDVKPERQVHGIKSIRLLDTTPTP